LRPHLPSSTMSSSSKPSAEKPTNIRQDDGLLMYIHDPSSGAVYVIFQAFLLSRPLLHPGFSLAQRAEGLASDDAIGCPRRARRTPSSLPLFPVRLPLIVKARERKGRAHLLLRFSPAWLPRRRQQRPPSGKHHRLNPLRRYLPSPWSLSKSGSWLMPHAAAASFA
jgi:hypothetical protein